MLMLTILWLWHTQGRTNIPGSHEYVREVLEVNGYVSGAIFRVFPYRCLPALVTIDSNRIEHSP